MKTYNSMIKNYNTTIKQLSEFLPPGNSIPLDDEFERFKRARNNELYKRILQKNY